MTDLIPPDYNQCQCEIRPAHGPFKLGPKPKYERCKNLPTFLAVEIVAGEDGQYGAMTLCTECCKVMLDNVEIRRRVQLQPIFREETG